MTQEKTRCQWAVCLIGWLAVSLTAFTQTPSIKWGNVQDISKRGGDLSIVHTDETGIYMIETHVKASVRPYGIKLSEPKIKYEFIKFDKNFNLVFEHEINTFFEEYDYDGLYTLGNELYVFARKDDKDAFTHTILAAKVNRSTGKLVGTLKEVVTLPAGGKRERMTYDVAQATDEQSWLIKIELSEDNNSTYYIARVDASLKRIKPKQFYLPSEETYTIKGIENLGVNKVLCIGDKYEMVDVGKKKPVRRKTGIAVDLYGENGRKLKSLPSVVSGKFIMEAQLMSENKHWYLVGSYCNTAKVDEIHGYFRAGIDAENAAFTQPAITQVNQALMGSVYQELLEKQKTRKEKKNDDDHEDDGLSSNLRLLKIIENKDGGITYVAERFWVEVTQSLPSTSFSTGGPITTRAQMTRKEIYAEIIVMKTATDGSLQWAGVLPKRQENIMGSTAIGPASGFSILVSPRVPKLMDMYHSAGLYMQDNFLYMLFNDLPENEQVLKPGDKVKTLANRKDAVAFIVKCNLETGSFSRYRVPKEKDEPGMLPKMGFVMDNTFIVPAISLGNLGRTKGDLRLGRLSL